MSERSQLRGRLAEAALILTSILLAFAIDAAWEDRQARLLRKEVISVATLEAVANREQLELTVGQTEVRLRQIDLFFAMTPVPGSGERLDSLASIILALPNSPSIQPSLSGALMLAQTPLLDSDDIAVRSAVDRWLQERSGVRERGLRGWAKAVYAANTSLK